MEKYGLVLEGGGMRGAYTAGVLTWLSNHHIKLNYSVGISTGAVYLCAYLMGNTKALYELPVHYASDRENVGWRAILREGRLVAYNHLFDVDLHQKAGLNLRRLKEINPDMEIGAYDLGRCETIWFKASEADDDLQLLKAACALPIAGPAIEYNGHKLMDGGITKMIPIERAVEVGCTKFLIITTKPADFVRKPANGFMRWLMKMNFQKYPKEVEDYKVRHLNYNRQMEIVNNLVAEKKAMLLRPSKTIDVSRFFGDPKDLEVLYQLGISDMESRRDQLQEFLKDMPA